MYFLGAFLYFIGLLLDSSGAAFHFIGAVFFISAEEGEMSATALTRVGNEA